MNQAEMCTIDIFIIFQVVTKVSSFLGQNLDLNHAFIYVTTLTILALSIL